MYRIWQVKSSSIWNLSWNSRAIYHLGFSFISILLTMAKYIYFGQYFLHWPVTNDSPANIFVSHKHIYIQPFIENFQTHFRIYHDQIQGINSISKFSYDIVKHIYSKHINKETNYSYNTLKDIFYKDITNSLRHIFSDYILDYLFFLIILRNKQKWFFYRMSIDNTFYLKRKNKETSNV